MKYKGSCHCGKIAYEVEGEIGEVLDCNCSMCQRRGGLLWFVPADKFRLLTDPKDMGTYLFNKHVIKHHFCKTCGISPYSEGKGPGDQPMAAVNARCLEGIEIESLKVKHFNGRAM